MIDRVQANALIVGGGVSGLSLAAALSDAGRRPPVVERARGVGGRHLTNNPKKINDLARFGVKITGRRPHVSPPNEHNRFYLETKALTSGHHLDLSGKPHLEEQGEPIVVEGGDW